MGNHESRNSAHMPRPSTHSAYTYAKTKKEFEKSTTKSNIKLDPHFKNTAQDFNKSASQLQDALPEALKMYSNSIEVMYRFWCSEIESLPPNEFKVTTILFYMNVFTKLPRTRGFFKKNIEIQAKQFFGMFRWLITNLKQPDTERLIHKIRLLGQMHEQWGIKPEWYTLFLEAFHETIFEIVEEKYTSRTKFCIEQLYTLVMNIMLNKDFKSLSSDNIAHLLMSLNKLEDCLNDKEARGFLALYMRQQFCVELMLFYEDYKQFKSCINKVKKQQIGKEIIDKYFEDNAECEVNVSYVNRNGVFHCLAVNKNVFTDTIFDTCCKECVELMRSNVWIGFSKQIKKMAVDADIKYEQASKSMMSLYDSKSLPPLYDAKSVPYVHDAKSVLHLYDAKSALY